MTWCGTLRGCLASKFNSCNSLLSSVHTLRVNILSCVRLYIKTKILLYYYYLFLACACPQFVPQPLFLMSSSIYSLVICLIVLLFSLITWHCLITKHDWGLVAHWFIQSLSPERSWVRIPL